MKLLVLLVSDKGVGVGVDPEDDFFLAKVQNAPIGTVLEIDSEICVRFSTIELALIALSKAGAPDYVHTARSRYWVSDHDFIERVIADLFGDARN